MLAILLLPGELVALNPWHRVDQYGHRSWSLRDGALTGYPRAIAQTADGYLWLAAESALVRFDGLRFSPWRPPEGAWPADAIVDSLLAARDGSLWIGTTHGLAQLKNGVLMPQRALDGQYVTALVQTRDGTIWSGTHGGTGNSTLCALSDSDAGVECYGRDGSLGRFILSLSEDREGSLWIGASNGLWRWSRATPSVYATPRSTMEIHAVVDAHDSTLVVATSRSLLRFAQGKFESYPVDFGRELKPTALLRDRDGGLWIGTQNQGLLRVHQGRVERFDRADGLSADFVVSLFEDREGNVWVGTVSGLDQFRQVAAIRISTKDGLANDAAVAVEKGRDGSVWISTIGGLDRWNGGRIERYAVPGVVPGESVGSLLVDRRGRLWASSLNGLSCVALEDGTVCPDRIPRARHVHAIAEDSVLTLWISDQNRGLIRWRDGATEELVPWSTFDGQLARSLQVDSTGGLWLGFIRGGIAYFKDSRVTRFVTTSEGLADGRVNSLYLDRGDVLWVATQQGLSRIDRHSVRTIGAGNGLPCGAVQWVAEDNNRSLWLHTSCGLVHVTRVDVEHWASGQRSLDMRLTVYDNADGVLHYSDLGGYGPKVTKTEDGRLWFATYDGVGVIDPSRLPNNPFPPPVRIEAAISDRTAYDASRRQQLFAPVRDLRIDYTALSLVAPEKIRFRYKLEGRDREWVDATDRRQAFYTDVPPGAYRFTVVASNDRGVWNDVGAAWEFSIEPMLYQTSAFQWTTVMLVILALYGVYRFRVRRLATELSMRFDERLAERTRIAQDLHDTLLQGFVSCSIHLHFLIADLGDLDTRRKLAPIVDRIGQLIDEGRQTVTGLRAAPPNDLKAALVRDAEYFRGDQPIDIQVAVNGEQRDLDPLVRDAVYQIGREALSNAFRHAQARRIEIDLEFATDGLCLSVRDDGRGIEPHVLESGRTGHWGLRGMQDRAATSGGDLTVWSRANAGTDVRLRVPARIAFAVRTPRQWRWLAGRFGRKNATKPADTRARR